MFSRYTRPVMDHFEPEVDAETQRGLRGLLEKIDYTAFASNNEVLRAMVGTIDEARVQRLAVAGAQARARWIAAALKAADSGGEIAVAEAETLADMRAVFEELSAAYEALRRMVERGYVRIGTRQAKAG